MVSKQHGHQSNQSINWLVVVEHKSWLYKIDGFGRWRNICCGAKLEINLSRSQVFIYLHLRTCNWDVFNWVTQCNLQFSKQTFVVQKRSILTHSVKTIWKLFFFLKFLNPSVWLSIFFWFHNFTFQPLHYQHMIVAHEPYPIHHILLWDLSQIINTVNISSDRGHTWYIRKLAVAVGNFLLHNHVHIVSLMCLSTA